LSRLDIRLEKLSRWRQPGLVFSCTTAAKSTASRRPGQRGEYGDLDKSSLVRYPEKVCAKGDIKPIFQPGIWIRFLLAALVFIYPSPRLPYQDRSNVPMRAQRKWKPRRESSLSGTGCCLYLELINGNCSGEEIRFQALGDPVPRKIQLRRLPMVSGRGCHGWRATSTATAVWMLVLSPFFFCRGPLKRHRGRRTGSFHRAGKYYGRVTTRRALLGAGFFESIRRPIRLVAMNK
jgi:hypothetical protein